MRMMRRRSSTRSSSSSTNATTTRSSRRLSLRRISATTRKHDHKKEDEKDNRKDDEEEERKEEIEEEEESKELLGRKEERRDDHDDDDSEEDLSGSNKIKEIASVFNFDSKLETKFQQVYQQLHEDNVLEDDNENDPEHHIWEIARYVTEFRKLASTKIMQLYKNRLKWRHDNSMDTFVASYGIPSAVFQYLPLYLLEDLDYDGNPLYVASIGSFDAWGMYQRVGCNIDVFLNYTKFLQEITTTRLFKESGGDDATNTIPDDVFHWQTNWYEPKFTTSAPQGGEGQRQRRRLSQFTMLVDLEGLSTRRHLRPALFQLFGAVARVGQDYYAGYARRIILLRAPRIFQMAWNFIQHFLDPHIIDLIKVTTASDYLDVCDQYLNRKSLPACIAPLEGQGRPIPNSFFECIHMQGGEIPQHITLETPCTHRAVPPNAKVGSPWPTTTTSTTTYNDSTKKPSSFSTAITTTLSSSSSSDSDLDRTITTTNCRSIKLLSGHLDDYFTTTSPTNDGGDEEEVVVFSDSNSDNSGWLSSWSSWW